MASRREYSKVKQWETSHVIQSNNSCNRTGSKRQIVPRYTLTVMYVHICAYVAVCVCMHLFKHTRHG
jgi:hypothetical protein